MSGNLKSNCLLRVIKVHYKVNQVFLWSGKKTWKMNFPRQEMSGNLKFNCLLRVIMVHCIVNQGCHGQGESVI